MSSRSLPHHIDNRHLHNHSHLYDPFNHNYNQLRTLVAYTHTVNNADVASVCRLVPFLLKLPQLSTLHLDHVPSSCVGDIAWAQTGLAVPPDEVIRDGWGAVLQFSRAGPSVPVYELRLMLIGDGEVGKTSLEKAFKAPSRRTERIPKEQRTVGIDISEMKFESADAPTIKCQVCDFAGQAVYYFSHTLHFTRRCIYILLWTTHKFSDSGAPQALSVADILGPLKRWLQLLAANVPEANVLIVGTHCSIAPETFDSVRSLVEKEVREEMQRLQIIAVHESAATRQVLQRHHTNAQVLCQEILVELAANKIQLPAPRLELVDVDRFAKQLKDMRPIPKRMLRRKSELLLETMLDWTRTKLRLGRLHAVHDGSMPNAAAPVAHLKLVGDCSFAVDTIQGVGVAELLAVIEATCRDGQALPFMGEQVPVSWMQVDAALMQQQTRNIIGNCVLTLENAVSKVRAALQAQLDVDVELARHLSGRSVQSSLEFWSLLGRVFVHDGHFLCDPRLIIDLLKPLVHHNILDPKFGFRKEFLAAPADVSCNHFLQELHKRAVLDHRLLPHLAAWASSSIQAHESMLLFFKETFMISDIRARNLSEVGAGNEPHRSLVTARLFDSSDGERQKEVETLADDVAARAVFRAIYALPSAHIGIMARMIAFIEELQPSKIALAVNCAQNHVCIERGPSQCAASVRSLSDVFESDIGSIKDELPPGHFSHALVISSNDDGLFAFAARCVDGIMRSGSVGAMYQCWLPYRSSAADSTWRPKKEDWVEVNSPENLKSLSEVLSANASDVVIASHNLKLRDLLPRRPRIFMSHTFSGDGTGECCQRIKSGLQERLLCTVWFDKAEMGRSDAFIDEMKRGMANATAFVVCLSPLYLTRPNCLRELMWAMDICATDQCKKLCIIPMHPSVSYAGCKSIIKLAEAGCAVQVVLPVDDRSPRSPPAQLQQLKGHKLSEVAISLLKRMTGEQNVGTNAEWLKLQPWLSDAEGGNWEDASQPWVGPCEGEIVEMETLLQALVVDIQAALLGACTPAPWSAFTNMDENLLQSSPPSQDYQAVPDTALLRSAFPHLLRSFPEEHAVRLIQLGLRDADAVDCIHYGLMKSSAASASQLNPVDAVFRMAAQMSRADFDEARRNASLSGRLTADTPSSSSHIDVPSSSPSSISAASSASTHALAPSPDHPLFQSPSDFQPLDTACGGGVAATTLDALACELSRINLSSSNSVLAHLGSRLQACGVFCLDDLKGMSREDVMASVADAKLTPLQFNRLFAAVSML